MADTALKVENVCVLTRLRILKVTFRVGKEDTE